MSYVLKKLVAAHLIALSVFLLQQPAGAWATEYFVSPSGNDTNSGLTMSAPFKTLAKSVGALRPGDTLYLNGTFTETLNLNSKRGTAGSPITIANYSGTRPIIDGQRNRPTVLANSANYITFTGITFANSSSYGLEAVDSSNLIVTNCEVSYSQNGGLVFRGGSNILVDGAHVHHTNQLGLTASHEAVSFAGISGFEIRNSHVHDGGEEGIDAKYGSVNGKIHHNTVTANRGPNIYIDGASAIAIYNNNVSVTTTDSNDKSNITLAVEISAHKVSDIAIYNNILHNALGGISFFVDPGLPVSSTNFNSITVFNNLFYKHTSRGAFRSAKYAAHISNLQVKNNIFWGNTTNFDDTTVPIIDNNIFSNTPTGAKPAGSNARTTAYIGFMNESPGSLDFRLKPDSPAIDAGINLGITRDYDNTARPQGVAVDIGPFERISTSATLPPVPTLSPTTAHSPTPARSPTPGRSPTPAPSLTVVPVAKIGDANNDNRVDEADSGIWKAHYLQTVTGANKGDFNGDGRVNGIDYIVWLNHYGT